MHLLTFLARRSRSAEMKVSREGEARRAMIMSAVVAVLALVVTATPVAADTELGQSGQVGQHSLRDNDVDHPGVICRSKTVASGPGGYERLLKRSEVRPPRMRSVGSYQRVGWRFIVQRLRKWSDEQVWKTTYRSPVQKATAYSGVNASFDPMDVAVDVPADSYNDPFYRVRVTMLWYRADGSVSGSARHSVDYYGTTIDGDPSFVQSWADGDYCTGYEAVHADGQ